MGLEVGVDLGFPEAENVRAEAEAGEFTGAPAAKHARDREPEEVGNLAGGQERLGVASDVRFRPVRPEGTEAYLHTLTESNHRG
jgi:hypothetical protein